MVRIKSSGIYIVALKRATCRRELKYANRPRPTCILLFQLFLNSDRF